MGAGILLTLILLFASQLSFAGSTARQGTLARSRDPGEKCGLASLMQNTIEQLI